MGKRGDNLAGFPSISDSFLPTRILNWIGEQKAPRALRTVPSLSPSTPRPVFVPSDPIGKTPAGGQPGAFDNGAIPDPGASRGGKIKRQTDIYFPCLYVILPQTALLIFYS